jgi:ligand-binding sensor domain-containing protein
MIQQAIFLLLATLLFSSCGIIHKKDHQRIVETIQPKEVTYATVPTNPELDSSLLVSQYIRRIFEDSKGYLWFGTNNDGVVRYNPNASDSTGNDTLVYFSVENGFGGYAVRGITEDEGGNLWFATDQGVTKYDGQKFFNYTTENGLPSNDVWSILVDRNGTVWAGTMLSACRFTGEKLANGEPLFTAFIIPEATEINPVRDIGPKIIWQMLEDNSGNIWFTTYGGGAYVYDGKTLANISKENGLTDGFVNCIFQDQTESIWIATQRKGAFRFNYSEEDGLMTNFTPKDGLGGFEIWTMMEDNTGNIWFSARGSISRYNAYAANPTFITYTFDDGMTNCCVQSIFQDSKGTIWFGSGDGLFRFQGDNPPPGEPKFIPVMKNGPWK